MNVTNKIKYDKPDDQQEQFSIYRKRPQFKYQDDRIIYKQPQKNEIQSSAKLLTEKFQIIEQKFTKKNFIKQLNQIYQTVYQVIFLKQSIMSLLKQQKIKMGDFIRDIKKYVFQLQMKIQRTGILLQSKMSQNLRQSKIVYEQSFKNLNNNSITLGNSIKNNKQKNQIQKDNVELQRKCEQLSAQNQFLKEQYQKCLSKYQDQINNLMNNVHEQTQNNNVDDLHEQIIYLKQIIEESNEILKNQQHKYKQKIKYLQNQIISLEDEYIKEKQANQRQLMRYREKEKMYMFQETQIQRKNILLIERQKTLYQRQNSLKQQRYAIQRRQNKVSDYQHNQMRRDKEQKQIERNNLRNQYYGGSITNIPGSKHETAVKRLYTAQNTERERSTSSRHNGLDINTRLRQIQQQKRKLGFNNIKGSRMSQANHRRQVQSRSVSRDNYYSKPIQHQTRQPIGLQNVGTKLTDMLSNLQKQLNDIK